MTLTDRALLYIHRLCGEIGVDADKIYNPATGAWYFANGGTTVEVFLTNQKNAQQITQTFIRCMAALCEIPASITQQHRLYSTALAINATYLGFKISADDKRGLVCIIAERDISGMDYEEMVRLINELTNWAERLEKFIRAEFS